MARFRDSPTGPPTWVPTLFVFLCPCSSVERVCACPHRFRKGRGRSSLLRPAESAALASVSFDRWALGVGLLAPPGRSTRLEAVLPSSKLYRLHRSCIAFVEAVSPSSKLYRPRRSCIALVEVVSPLSNPYRRHCRIPRVIFPSQCCVIVWLMG